MVLRSGFYSPRAPGPLVFLHIPKTAGTSFHQVLENEYRDAPSFSITGTDPLKRRNELLELPQKKKEELVLLKGHLLQDGDEILGKKCHFLSFLRDPVDRTISSYYYIKRAKHNRFHEEVKDLTLREFTDFLKREKWDNLQTRYLSSTPEEIRYKGKRPDRQEMKEERFPKALEFLRNKIDSPLLVEEMDRSLIYLYRVLDWNHIPDIGKKNASKERPPKERLSTDLLERLREVNQLDETLYNEAVRIFWKNLEQVWDERLEELFLKHRRKPKKSFFECFRLRSIFRWES